MWTKSARRHQIQKHFSGFISGKSILWCWGSDCEQLMLHRISFEVNYWRKGPPSKRPLPNWLNWSGMEPLAESHKASGFLITVCCYCDWSASVSDRSVCARLQPSGPQPNTPLLYSCVCVWLCVAWPDIVTEISCHRTTWKATLIYSIVCSRSADTELYFWLRLVLTCCLNESVLIAVDVVM